MAYQNPPHDCDLCPRLKAFRHANVARYPGYFNAPVPAFAPPDGAPRGIDILIVGLAPGIHGANQTGRPFTGDAAGDLLYETLLNNGLAVGEYGKTPDDGLQLRRCQITNAVRCVPPENKPVGAEIKACRPFLAAEIADLTDHHSLRACLSLGLISHKAVIAALGLRQADYTFAHGAIHSLPGGLLLADSYHCSRYNTNTGRLTAAMFDQVFKALLQRIAK